MARQRVFVRTEMFSPLEDRTMQSRDDLASLFLAQGRYRAAEQLDEETLALRRSLLPPGHRDTFESMNGLATVYEREGRYDKAEPLYRKALQGRREVLGAEDPDTQHGGPSTRNH